MSIVTDSGEGIPENVYNIHKLLRNEEELKIFMKRKKGKYKDLKEALLEDIEKLLEPMREKRVYWEAHIDEALEILKSGGEKDETKSFTKNGNGSRKIRS